MDQLREISLPPRTDSSPNLPTSINQSQQNYAAERARILFGCYRKGEANDPEIYTAATTAILAEYSAEVIQRVTDPRTGIPRKLKFMPNPAEVAEACDQAKIAIAAEKKIAADGWHWNGEKWARSAE